MKERFQERKEAEPVVERKWDRNELDTSGTPFDSFLASNWTIRDSLPAREPFLFCLSHNESTGKIRLEEDAVRALLAYIRRKYISEQFYGDNSSIPSYKLI